MHQQDLFPGNPGQHHQWSGIGLASYVVTASDLRLKTVETPRNSIHKYADDTCLLVPASNSLSCADLIDNVEIRAEENKV